MKTWNDYKEHVKAIDSESAKDIEELNKISNDIDTISNKEVAPEDVLIEIEGMEIFYDEN